jgi:hypothetical protein
MLKKINQINQLILKVKVPPDLQSLPIEVNFIHLKIHIVQFLA